jgi:hypothetical protein
MRRPSRVEIGTPLFEDGPDIYGWIIGGLPSAVTLSTACPTIKRRRR